jgi:alpha-L-rhamnosidase
MEYNEYALDSKTDFKAHWIWDNQDGPANTWMCFRKTFQTQQIPSSAKTYISVDSKYWLWVNGKLVVLEGGLNRGPKPSAGYYDVVELREYLSEGLNTVAILVWYWGNEGRNSVDSGMGGLLFQCDLEQQSIISDQTWKIQRNPAYRTTDLPHPAYLYGGHNIGFDASMDIVDWNMRDYDDSDWKQAVHKGVPPCEPWGELYERPIPLIKDYGLKEYIEVNSCGESRGTVYTATLPYASYVNPIFLINSCKAGIKVDIRTDRYEVNGGPGDENRYNSHRVEYITKEGLQQFEGLNWIFGEKVIYTFPEGIDVLSLKYRETGYDAAFDGNFLCNDNLLNKLYEKCRRTLYICMRDNYMDCPDRERGQWIGDVSSQVPQTFYALERSADYLTKKAIHNFINWRSNSILRGNVPGVHSQELPSQSLNAISEIGMIMSYYINSGDSTILYQCYDAIKEYLWLWNIQDDGTLLPRKGDWYWFDHGEYVDNAVLEAAWYYSALKAGLIIAVKIGRNEDEKEFVCRMKKISDNFDRLFWRGEGYSSTDFYDDRANAMAVLSGLTSDEKWPQIKNVLTEIRNATPYMEGYVLEALFVMGYCTDAVNRMTERYGPLIANENSTLWEDFYLLGTRNHAWSGAPLTILSKYIAGISPIIPGYVIYQILPQLGSLTKLEITVPSIKGKIEVSIIKEEGKFELSLKSPAGTTAMVGIPKNLQCNQFIDRITVSNIVLWEAGRQKLDIPGVQYIEEDESFIKFEVMPGTWTFVSQK